MLFGRFPYIDGPSFSPYKSLYEMFIFERSVTCSFFRNCTHMLRRTQGKKFEDMFLVKIASKGTSLNLANSEKFMGSLSHTAETVSIFDTLI